MAIYTKTELKNLLQTMNVDVTISYAGCFKPIIDVSTNTDKMHFYFEINRKSCNVTLRGLYIYKPIIEFNEINKIYHFSSPTVEDIFKFVIPHEEDPKDYDEFCHNFGLEKMMKHYTNGWNIK